MAYSDVIIRQCGPRDADSDNDLRILWRMLKMMKTGFIIQFSCKLNLYLLG